MKQFHRIYHYFTRAERLLWCGSVLLILGACLLFDRGNGMNLCASLIGVTSLILNAKGNPWGQLLMVLFSLLYGGISWSFAYYGEMLTYLGMTMPMAVAALVSWLKHPYSGNRSEVAVQRMKGRDWGLLTTFTLLVTVGFYFVLKALGTANLLPSTLSVATSFAAVFLTCKRSPWYAVGYAANDVVLVLLWILASLNDRGYLSVVVCFVVFLMNDLYGFVNWRRMERRQANGA